MFKISICVAKRRKINPTHKASPGRSQTIRTKETFDASVFILDRTTLNQAPLLESTLNTVKYKFKTETVAKMIVFVSSKLSTNIKKKVIGKWNRSFYSSNGNCFRSINLYYSHNVIGKRKYLSLRKAHQ